MPVVCDRILNRVAYLFFAQVIVLAGCAFGARARVKRVTRLSLMTCVGTIAVVAHAEVSCPDLTGTFEARSTAWIDKFHLQATGTVRPKTQAKQFATFQRRADGYTLTWHMPRQDVVAAARVQAKRDPYKYGEWLDLILRDPALPLPLGMEEQAWANHIAIFGPVFRVDTVLPLRQCEGGWFLVGRMGSTGPAEIEGGMDGTRDVELWFGRDQDGALSQKWVERRKVVVMSSSRYFKESAVRLWSSPHLDKWPAAPALDISPMRAEELPDGKRPSRNVPKCQIAGDPEAVFIQRLKANLPPRVEIQGHTSYIDIGRLRADGTCEPMPYTLSVSAPDAAAIARLAEYLRTDPMIREIKAQESQVWGEGLLVRFRMMAAP